MKFAHKDPSSALLFWKKVMILIVFRGKEYVLFRLLRGIVDKYNVFILHTNAHIHMCFFINYLFNDCCNFNIMVKLSRCFVLVYPSFTLNEHRPSLEKYIISKKKSTCFQIV